MQCTIRVSLAVLVIACAVAARPSPVRADEQLANEVHTVLSVAIARDWPTNASTTRGAKLSPLLHVSIKQLQWKNDRLTWICPTQRTLRDTEQKEALRLLREWLLNVAEAQPDPAVRTRLTGAFQNATLGIGARWPIHSLVQDPSDAIGKHLGETFRQMIVGGAINEPQFAEIRRIVKFDPKAEIPWIGSWDGAFNIGVELRDPAVARRYGQRQGQLFQQFRDDPARLQTSIDSLSRDFLPPRTAQPLEQALQASLYQAEGGQRPLLSYEDARAVKIRINLPTIAAAPFAGNAAKPNVVRGTALRTRTTFVNQSLIKAAARDAFGDAPIEVGPQLVLDTQGFVGGGVNNIRFSPDGRWLAAAGDVVRIWDLHNGGELAGTLRGYSVPGASGATTDLAFSADGRVLAVAVQSKPGNIRLYDTANLKEVASILRGFADPIDRIAFSPDGHHLAAATAAGEIYICDWKRRQIMNTLRFPGVRAQIDCLHFFSDNMLFALDVRGQMARVSLGEVPRAAGSSFSMTKWLGAAKWPVGAPHPYSFAFDSTERYVAACGYGRNEHGDNFWAAVWNATAGMPIAKFDLPYHATACALDADSEQLAVADARGTIHVWRIRDGERLWQLAGDHHAAYAVEFDDESQQVRFGRTPHRGAEWQRNRYAALDHQFDIAQRRFAAIETREAVPPREHASLMLKMTAPPLGLSVYKAEKQQSFIPVSPASKSDMLTFGFLHQAKVGIDDPAVLGMETGELYLFDTKDGLIRRNFIGHTDRVWDTYESADGRLLVSASGDGTIRFWSLDQIKDWGNLAALFDPGNVVYHVYPSTPTQRAKLPMGTVVEFVGDKNANTLASLAFQAKWPFRAGEVVNVWPEGQRWQGNAKPYRVELSPGPDFVPPLLNLFVSKSGLDWIMWTQEGYYDCTPGAEKYLGWHINRGFDQSAEFRPLSQYNPQYRRPDVIDLVLRAGSTRQALKLADAKRKAEVPPIVVPTPVAAISLVQGTELPKLPQVSLIAPASYISTADPEIDVQAEISVGKDSEEPQVVVLVNQTPHRVTKLKKSRTTSDHDVWEFAKPQSVTLKHGDNRLEVVATNRIGRNAEGSAVVTVENRRVGKPLPPVTDKIAPQSQLVVLSIGISDYKDEDRRLDFADDDARAFARFCEEQKKSGLYSNVKVKQLIDRDADGTAIKTGLTWLEKQSKEDDLLVIFISGHGETNGSTYYFCPYDFDGEHRVTGLAWSEFQNFAQDASGRRLLLIADTCRSGELARIDDDQAALRRAGSDRGLALFAACGVRSVSQESAEHGHGYFVEALLQVVSDRSLDKHSPGVLTLYEFEQHLKARCTDLTEYKQLPICITNGLNYPIFGIVDRETFDHRPAKDSP